MNEEFKRIIDSLEPAFQQLMSREPVTVTELPKAMSQKGVYLFSEGIRHLYVGRTNRLRQRLQQHCQPSSSHNQATFAFRMAREATGNTVPAYTSKGSRSALLRKPAFKKEFARSKGLIRQMDIRFIDEEDSMRQALLEMYVAVALQTQYNDFDNH